MYYTIYKITNQITGKFYIGKHKTSNLDDNYMGSGKLIKRAMHKYGIKNFIKEYIEILDSEKKMALAEKIYVIIDDEVSYNLCEGGKGGFGYINSNFTASDKKIDNARKIHTEKYNTDINYRNRCQKSYKRRSLDNEYKKKISKGLKKHYENNDGHFKGKSHSIETLQKLKKSKNIGSKNPQYGTCWITNGQENKKIKKEDIDNWVKLGYYKGRFMDR